MEQLIGRKARLSLPLLLLSATSTLARIGSPQSAAATPEQIFITRSGLPGEMVISWATQSAADTNETVLFGTSPSALTSTALGTSAVLTDSMTTPLRIHVATLTDLAPGTTYYYSVGGGAGPTLRFASSTTRHMYAVFGDLGLADDFSLTTLLAEAKAGVYDAVMFAGDLAYNLEDSGGTVGNEFMNGLQPIISELPIFTVAGNHGTLRTRGGGSCVCTLS